MDRYTHKVIVINTEGKIQTPTSAQFLHLRKERQEWDNEKE